MTRVEVVVTVRVPEGTDVAAVAETVASWSAPLDAGVGWRVVAVEGIEPLGEEEEVVVMTSAAYAGHRERSYSRWDAAGLRPPTGWRAGCECGWGDGELTGSQGEASERHRVHVAVTAMEGEG